MNSSNAAFDYDASGHDYSSCRRADERVAAYVQQAFGPAQSILNVGAGAYEPQDRYVVAVEPSAAMWAQRTALGRIPAIDATAGRLPFLYRTAQQRKRLQEKRNKLIRLWSLPL